MIEQTPEEIVTEISMSQNKRWLILEGSSDYNFFCGKNFFNNIVYKDVGGWENVRDVVEKSYTDTSHNVVGLIDRDYRDLTHENPEHPKIVITDLHDIENILFESNALNAVYTQYGGRDKLPRRGQPIDIKSIKKEIDKAAIPLGIYRAYCYANKINISFKDLDYDKFIDKNNLSFNIQNFENHLRGKPGNRELISQVKWKEAQSCNWASPDFFVPVLIRHGHDLMEIIAISLKKKYGSQKGSFSHEDTERLFSLAIEEKELQNYSFWNKLNRLLANSNIPEDDQTTHPS